MARRTAVKRGLCTEAESVNFINNFMHEQDIEDPTRDIVQMKREQFKKDMETKMTTVHQRYQEQEYYFDESLGVSVSSHIEHIQQ